MLSQPVKSLLAYLVHVMMYVHKQRKCIFSEHCHMLSIMQKILSLVASYVATRHIKNHLIMTRGGITSVRISVLSI